MLDQSCRDAAAWTAAGRPLTVHVNVSVAQLADDRLLTVVASCLRRSGLPPEQLVLEITESMVLEAPDALRRVHDLAATACGSPWTTSGRATPASPRCGGCRSPS